jgi:hypothetical protein
VAGPIAATRARAKADHGNRRAPRRRSTIVTPFTLVKMTQLNRPTASIAASNGSQDGGGSIAIVGVSRTRAPADCKI